MKQFIIWVIIFAFFFGGSGFYYHQYLSENPKKLVIAVDESFKMNNLMPRIREQLNSLKDRNYTIFCVVTSQRKVHDWESRPNLDGFSPFGPRDFAQMAENINLYANEADEIIVITNAKDVSELKGINNINIMQLQPLTD